MGLVNFEPQRMAYLPDQTPATLSFSTRTHRVSELPTAAFRLVCRMGGAMLRHLLCQPMPPAWRQHFARTFGGFLPVLRGIVGHRRPFVLCSPPQPCSSGSCRAGCLRVQRWALDYATASNGKSPTWPTVAALDDHGQTPLDQVPVVDGGDTCM
jgi:hypothetical protein